MEGCGVYDNIGHGIQTEGETCVTDCDILCNQRHAISAEGAANIKVSSRKSSLKLRTRREKEMFRGDAKQFSLESQTAEF